MWWIYLIISGVLALNEGVRLYPCGDAGYQDVVENTAITFYCDQYTESVEWRYKNPNTKPATLSTCTATSCPPSAVPAWGTVTFISATNSSLTSSRTSRTPALSGSEYQCVTEKCGLHVIVPAVVSQPTTPGITRQDSGYTVSLSADITQVYSSRGLYSCVWQLGTDRKTPAPDLDSSASNTDITTDRSGSCAVTMPLPSNTGDHSCSVTVSPGNTQKSCDTITITRPSPPNISCPTDVIAENMSLTCTCNTNNIGQPWGRLRWYTTSDSDVITEVISGNYDVSSLSMTWRVSRADHVRKFRCVNNWTVNITGQNYTARVAWGPDSVNIQGGTTLYTDTSGSKNLTLTCKASQVNPTSNLTYSWNIPCNVTQQSTCTFSPRPPGPGNSGDINKVITCTVTNVKNNNKQQQANVTLDLKYPPRSAPRISSFTNTSALHPNTSLTLTCNVAGGDPVVTSVTLTCLGRKELNTTSGQSSSLVISPVTAADHNLTCECHGLWVNESYYTLTSSRTLIVYYAVTETTMLANSNVSVTLNESEAVTLVCQSRGVPAPALQLLQRDVTLVRQDGGSLPTEWSQLTHSDVARCNNTGTVTCRADNGVGDGQHTSVQLQVNCKPRSSKPKPNPPEVNFMIQPVTVTFHLEAFPLPDVFSFHYLGSNQSSSSSHPVPNSIELNVTCTNTFADYAVLCNVTVQSVQDSTAEGFYTFTAANAFGEERLMFLVKVNASAANTAGMDAVALGAGLGAGLAVLVLVIIVVCCVCRRKNKKDRSKARNGSTAPPRAPVGQAAVIQDPPPSPYEDFHLEASANPSISSQPQPGSSSTPVDNVYTGVRKPNRAPPAQVTPAAAAAAVDGDDAVGEVNNEYAVVDKSRKTPAVSPSPEEPGPSGTHTHQPDAAPTVTVVRFNTGSAPEESVYENQAFQGDDNSPPATSEAASGGRTVNADGLVYTTVDFPENYQQKGKGVPAPLDMTDYTHINFVSRAQAAKKKKKK